MTQERIKELLLTHLYRLTNAEAASAQKSIQMLINQHVEEVIGEDEDPEEAVGMLDHKDILDRNFLRKEQRERAGL